MNGLLAAVAMLALASMLASGNDRRRRLALLLALAVLGVPFVWHPTSPFVAFVLALVGLWGAIRVVDLYREHPARSWRMRIWHVLAIFDTRHTTRIRPRVEAAAFGRGILLCAVGAGGAATVVYAAPRFDGAAHAVVRWLGGLVLVYGLASAVAVWLRSIYLLVGVAVPPIHRSPWASRSLREFWGDRWNRIVGRWLRETFFLPLARRRRTTQGLILAFVASALLHGYAATAAIGPAKAAPMVAFFLLQGALVLVERAMRVERLPAAWARVWFFTAMSCTLPLFLQPLLAILLPSSS